MRNNKKFNGMLGSIGERMALLHKRLANYLNVHTRNWSRQAKISLLIGLCIFFGSASLALIFEGLLSSKSPPHAIPHQPITVPSIYEKPDTINQQFKQQYYDTIKR